MTDKANLGKGLASVGIFVGGAAACAFAPEAATAIMGGCSTAVILLWIFG